MQITIKCGKNLNFAPITPIQTIKFGTFMQITSLKHSTIEEIINHTMHCISWSVAKVVDSTDYTTTICITLLSIILEIFICYIVKSFAFMVF